MMLCFFFFFFQAEDGIRDAQESRGLGDVYKRQVDTAATEDELVTLLGASGNFGLNLAGEGGHSDGTCLLYTSDAADEEDSVDLGGRRIIKKKKKEETENEVSI
eukprot:TRINITY_DN13898_c0_g1_i4.p2 TRINITY_DN13898_c0_g1~~TRINITY_DN13898_c0_g1_i4.p2  ORF type:complete len:104 (-),score=48.53 TRINITY_DN13898_c0_g1_i4:93-404(-)